MKDLSWKISIYCLIISFLVIIELIALQNKEFLAPLMISIVAFVLSIFSQWRFDYETMIDGETFEKELWNDRDDYLNQSDYDYQMIHQLTTIQRSKKRNNNTRVALIKQATTLLLSSCTIFIIVNILIILQGGFIK